MVLMTRERKKSHDLQKTNENHKNLTSQINTIQNMFCLKGSGSKQELGDVMVVSCNPH